MLSCLFFKLNCTHLLFFPRVTLKDSFFSRYMKTDGKTKKTQRPREPKDYPQKREERRRRRIKHSVVSSEPEKCPEKPKNGLTTRH